MSIEFQDVSKNFGKFKALDQVDFTVKEGEVVGFAGLNGAGKTTSMKIACGVINPSQGDVLIDGMSVRKDKIRINGAVAWVPENSLLDNMEKPKSIFMEVGTYLSMRRAEIIEIMQKAMKAVSLDTKANIRIGNMSNGMRKRMHIAIGIFMDSKNYLLDETFNGLDPSGVFFLKDTIRNLKKEGKSVLLSTHILPEISELCDRLIIINKGKILDNVMVDDIVNKVTVEVSFYCKNEIDNENIVNILSAFGDVELSIEESKRYGKATIKNYSGKKGSSFKVAESLNKIQLDVISLSERKEEVEEYFKRKISE